jgi:hypothetical protein
MVYASHVGCVTYQCEGGHSSESDMLLPLFHPSSGRHSGEVRTVAKNCSIVATGMPGTTMFSIVLYLSGHALICNFFGLLWFLHQSRLVPAMASELPSIVDRVLVPNP